MSCEIKNDNPALLGFLRNTYNAPKGLKAYLQIKSKHNYAFNVSPMSLKEQFGTIKDNRDKTYLDYNMAKAKVIAINKHAKANKYPIKATVKTELEPKSGKYYYSANVAYNQKLFNEYFNYPMYKLAENEKNADYVLEDITSARNWVNKNLKGIKVEEIKGLINGHGFGAFKENAILLSDKAPKGTVYHEAFHAVFRQYFTASERILMTEEAKITYEKPTLDTLKKYQKLYPNLTLTDTVNIYYEEQLANDFERFMVNDPGNPVKASEATKNLFQTLKDFIEKLLSIVAKDSNILSTFNDIKQGKYANTEYNISVANMPEVIDAMSYYFASKIETVRSKGDEFEYISSIEDLATLSNTQLKKFITDAMRSSLIELRKDLRIRVESIRDKAANVDAATAAQLNIIADEIKYIRESFNSVEVANQLIKNSLKFLTKFGIEVKFDLYNENTTYDILEQELEEDFESDKQTRNDIQIDKESVEVSVNEKMSPNIRYAIATLHKANANGEPILNDLGLPQLTDYRKTLNYLRHILQNTESFEEQIELLGKNVRKIPELSFLHEYLQIVEPSNDSKKAMKVRRFKTQFRQDFAKNYLGYSLLKIGEGDDNKANVFFLDPTETSLKTKLTNNWRKDGIMESLNPKNHIIVNIEGTAMINMVEFRKEVNRINKLEGKLLKNEGWLKLANSFGININPLSIDEQAKNISKLFNQIEDEKGNYNKDFEPLDRVFLDESIFKNDIISDEVAQSTDLHEHMHFGPDGKPRYSMTEYSYLSQMITRFNKSTSMMEARDKNILPDQYTTIFDYIKSKGGEIKLTVNEGISLDQIGKEGNKTSKLTYPDRILQSIRMAIDNNQHQIFTSSDKTMDYTVELPMALSSYSEFEKSSPDVFNENKPDQLNLKDEIVKFVADEILSVQLAKNGLEDDHKYIQYASENYEKLSLSVPFLKNVDLSKIETILTQPDWVFDDIVEYLKTTDINTNIDAYFDNLAQEYTNFLESNDIINRFEDNYDVHSILSGKQVSNLESKKVLTLMKSFAINDYFAKRDVIHMVMGNPKQMKSFIDFFKRASGPVGTKKFADGSPEMDNFINTHMTREDSKKADGLIKTSVISDSEVALGSKSYEYIKSVLGERLAKSFLKIEDADGQGFISLDEYREFLYRIGDWTQKHEDLYQKLINNQPISEKEKLAFSPLKPQYYGKTTSNFTTFQKYSLAPVFPNSKGEMKKLYESMKESQTGILVFASGVKIGAPVDRETGKPFEAFDGNTFLGIPNDSVYEIKYDTLGIQVDTGFKIKQKVPTGTQQRKIVTLDMMSKGKAIPMSFPTLGMMDTTIENTEAVLEDLNDAHNKKTEADLDLLLERLQFIKNADGTYSPTSVTPIKEELLRQINIQDTPQNVLDQINGLTLDDEASFIDSLRYPLDALLSKSKIESILLSIIKNNAIKPDVLGGQFYQVSNKFTNTDTDISTSTDLQFYRKGKNGETLPAQIKVPLPKHLIRLVKSFGGLEQFNALLKEFYSDDNNRYLNNELSEVHKILSGIAYRIPTQDKASMEIYEIVEFFNPSEGNKLVVPTGWTTKNGSDFDIDKLYVFFKEIEYFKEITKGDTKKVATKHFKFDLPDKVNQFLNFIIPHTDSFGRPFLGVFEQERLLSIPKEILVKLLDSLNNHSLTSNKGKFGDLYNKVLSKELTPEQYRFFERIKVSLMEFNAYRQEVFENEDNYDLHIDNYEIIQGDSSVGLQNDIIELQYAILASPESAHKLLSPLDSTRVESLADRLSYIRQGYLIEKANNNKINYPQWGLFKSNQESKSIHKVYEWQENLQIREDNWLGKQGVGIAAINSTSNSLFQKAGVEVENSDSSMLNFEGLQEYFEISKVTNAANDNISDVLKEFVTMYVDAGKNPHFPVELKAGIDNENTWMYLIRRGVPENTIGLFLNQPIVVEYNRQLNLNKSYLKQVTNRKFKKDIIKDLVNSYLNDIEGPREAYTSLFGENKVYSKEPLNDFNMAKNINTEPTTNSAKSEFAKQQLIALADYIKYDNLGKELSQIVMMTNQDTTVPKSFADSKLQLFNMQEIADVDGDTVTFKNKLHLANLDNLLENTLLKGFFKLNNVTRKLYNDIFVTAMPELDAKLYSLVKPMIDNRTPNDEIVKTINNFYNDFVTFLVTQANIAPNIKLQEKSKELFGKDNKFVKNLAAWYRDNKNSELVKNNMFLSNLEYITNDARSLTDSLKLYANKLSSFEEDRVVQDLRKLLKLNSFPDRMNLLYFGILQSGLSNSHLSYMNVLPHEEYAKLAESGMNNMIQYVSKSGKVTKNIIDLDSFNNFVSQFYANNYMDGGLVPAVKIKNTKRNIIMPTENGLKLGIKSPHSGRHYIKIIVPVEELQNATQFNRDEIYQQLKFEKKPTYTVNLYKLTGQEGEFNLYTKVSKRGDGFRHKEYYNDLRPSVHLANNKSVNATLSSIRLDDKYLVTKEENEEIDCKGA